MNDERTAPATAPARPSARPYGAVRGILVPQANTTVEPEMQVLLGGTVLAARLRSAAAGARERLVEYLDRIEEFLRDFDTAALEAAGFACTASSYFVGPEREDAVFAGLSAARGAPVLPAAGAIRRALGVLGARRIALVSPYPRWLHDAALGYWRAAGIEIVASHSLAPEMGDTRAIYGLAPPDLSALAPALALDRADAVLLSGTGMPTLPSLAAAHGLGRPVLASNPCLAWAMTVPAATGHEAERASLREWLGSDATWRRRLKRLAELP